MLRYIPKETNDPNLLVGVDHADDGSVYKLTDDIALIQTLDFFTPIVDDPYMFGQIAAANALSDVYAMGGKPITVLNIVAYPIEQLGPKVLADILKGSSDKVREAGAQVVGGHSIDDKEPKFGLSVTGTVHPDKFYQNIGAQPGDMLLLTKPIGVGILTTAIKRNLLTKAQTDQVTDTMRTLNKYAAETLANYHPNAVTDVTGFGLLGHAFEMASGSNVSFTIDHQLVPLLDGALELAKQEMFPAGSRANHAWLHKDVQYEKNISLFKQIMLCDAITSGGLLISLPKNEVNSFVRELNEAFSIHATVIGEVTKKKEKSIYVK